CLQGGKARSGPDGELSLDLGYGRDDATVVAVVSDEKDGASGSEVALFCAKLALGLLDVVKASLGFDDRIEIVGRDCRDAVGGAQLAGDGERAPRPPRADGSESGREPLKQRDMALVSNRRSDRVYP